MDVEISEEGPDALEQYAKVSVAFESDRVLDVEPAGTAGDVPRLSERVVVPRFFKDYDGIPGNTLDDNALLWDLRVNPTFGRHGVGSKLLAAAETWVHRRGGRRLTVETQNTNAAACRFYARHGFALESVNRVAYPDFPDETQLVWYKLLR